MNNVFKYHMKVPIMSESAYPYKTRQQKCAADASKGVVEVQGYKDVTPKNPKALMEAIAKTPVTIALCASSSSFRYFKSGVLTQNCSPCLNHAVIAVGYGELNGVNYWLIRNSWGSSWGDSGYIRILRTDKNDVGLCGMLQRNSYPIV